MPTVRSSGLLAFALLLSSTAALESTPAHADPPRRLTVDQAITLALASEPRLQAVGASARASHDQSLSAIGRMLPSVHLSEEYQHYDSPFDVTFNLPGLPPGMAPSFRARDQDTNSFAAVAVQPLLGLLPLGENYAAAHATAEAANAQVDSARASLREQMRTGYLRYFEAKAAQQIAQASEGELQQQVTLAQARLHAGVLTKADLLRVEVAAANARQQGIVAASQAEVTRANLLSAMGFSPDDASIELVEPTGLLAEARGRLPSFAPADSQALARRPELAQAEAMRRAADHRKLGTLFSLLPEISAEGAYLRIDGQAFVPPDSAYVGVKADWAFWEWGASWFQHRAAAAQASAAKLGVESERRQIGTELAGSLSTSRAAASAVEVAQATITSAEEAYRVMQAQVRAGTATTTDLLDSEAALTQARLNLSRAEYEQAVARVSLARVMGD